MHISLKLQHKQQQIMQNFRKLLILSTIIIITIVVLWFPTWINNDSMDTIQSNVRNEAYVLSLLFIVFSPGVLCMQIYIQMHSDISEIGCVTYAWL